MHLFSARLLIGMSVLLAPVAAIAAELPASDFLKPPPLTHPAISPDGKYLAVVASSNAGSLHPSYEVAVFGLPGMQPLSKLTMATPLVPGNIIWVSDTRLVVALHYGVGPLDQPSVVGNITAVNIDGSNRRTLYGIRNSWKTYYTNGNRPSPSGIDRLHLSPNIATAEALPLEPGHVAINVKLVSTSGVDRWKSERTLLYDVDTYNDHVREIGEIAHGRMLLIPYHGVARVAVGIGDDLQNKAFFSPNGKSWTPMPATEVGTAFWPLKISHDGKWLYALSSMDGGPEQLVECHLDGSGRTVLASNSFASVSDVMWDPVTESPLAAVFSSGGVPQIQFIERGADAKILAALAKGDPAELLTLADASRDGSRLLIHTASDRNPGTYTLFDTSTMQGHILYQVMPWITPSAMPARLPIRFTSRNGTELAGFLTLPPGRSRHLPLVLRPHGGPIDVSDTWFFDPWSALLASRGYAVLQINYRGSSGRGKHFRFAGYRQFASGIQDDLIDGVEWAIDKGYADPDRVCVFGEGFGGYAALMQPILAPNLYKCAVDYAGVYDWRIAVKRADASGSVLAHEYFRLAVGTADAAYVISPASRMKDFDVPALIASSKSDPHVLLENAIELRTALTKAGKPYEWFVRPGRMHGFHDVKDNQALFGAIQAFLAKYIGPREIANAPAPK